MLERYFTKRTDGRSHPKQLVLGEAIERYVTWLAERGYHARCVHHRFRCSCGSRPWFSNEA